MPAETAIGLVIFVWVLWLLWSGRSSKSDARTAAVYAQHFTREELAQIGRTRADTKA